MNHPLFLLALIIAAPILAPGQTWQRDAVTFEMVEGRARELAAAAYQKPAQDTLPKWMNELSYDQYRDIRFRPDQALWKEEGLPFRAMFFHPGYLFREPVVFHEFTGTHRQHIRLAEAFFDYGPLIKERGDLPADCGFAGFRLHAPLNNPEVFDELIVFQGASYWRALGKDQRYGISARGIAIDTGAEGGGEEFPNFREFWLQKPSTNDKDARLLALLDGPSCTGAYEFRVTPGVATTVEVRSVLFMRKPVKRLGVAPMSSMFWFGENSRRRFDDFRPEVHDSDGLAIRLGTGERLWRPVSNDTGRLEFSFFSMDKCDGFGLVQRDRRFAAYEDGEAAYHQRPSLWIQPTSDWGPGRVMLMEIPTANELADNIVALWEPAKQPAAGERLEFSYRQHWTMNPDPAEAGGHVVATRTGVHEWQPEQRTVVVEFSGGKLSEPGQPVPEADIQAIGPAADKVKIQGVAVQALPENRWRAAFQIVPAAEGGKLSDLEPVELRCLLKRGTDFLTETWTYRINP